jgi:hypothetical protein
MLAVWICWLALLRSLLFAAAAAVPAAKVVVFASYGGFLMSVFVGVGELSSP